MARLSIYAGYGALALALMAMPAAAQDAAQGATMTAAVHEGESYAPCAFDVVVETGQPEVAEAQSKRNAMISVIDRALASEKSAARADTPPVIIRKPQG